MKRSLFALTFATLAVSGMAHADRNTQVNLRVTEMTLPLMTAAQRQGETDAQMAADLIALRPEAEVMFGELYDMGALMKEQNVWWEDVAKDLDVEVAKVMKEEAWDKALNQDERKLILESFKHAVMDGYQGR